MNHLGSERAVIAVEPRSELDRHRRLFAALELAFPVTFQSHDQCGAVRSGTVLIADASRLPGAAPTTGPCLVVAETQPVRQGQNEGLWVQLSPGRELDGRLRGRRLYDGSAGAYRPLKVLPGDSILGSSGRNALWTRRSPGSDSVHLSAASLPELAESEPLRHRFREGCFLATLPLVHFLREVSAPHIWDPPEPRATFVIDDPNLHWHSYGYLDFSRLVEDADIHDYHVTMGMVPIDTWFASARAASIFRQNGIRISLAIHGNDHIRGELARDMPSEEVDRLLAQALARTARFERRSGLRVARIMVPPYGVCSKAVMRALVAAQFDALCFEPPDHESIQRQLASWLPTTHVSGSLPTIARRLITQVSDDLIFRAYLDQPLVVYGHHQDFAGGLEVFREAVSSITSIAAVRWISLAEIAATNFASKSGNGVLSV